MKPRNTEDTRPLEEQEEKYIRRPGGVSEERTVAFADADRRAVVREDGVDVRVGSSCVGATHLDT